MVALFNLIWFIFVGFWSALIMYLLGIIMCITIIGIPVGKALFQLAKLNAFPYGKIILRETTLKGKRNVSIIRKIGGLILNLIWFPIGLILTITYFIMGLAAAITIVGIPVAIVYIKMGKFLLFPIGAKVITKQQAYASAAEAMRRRV